MVVAAVAVEAAVIVVVEAAAVAVVVAADAITVVEVGYFTYACIRCEILNIINFDSNPEHKPIPNTSPLQILALSEFEHPTSYHRYPPECKHSECEPLNLSPESSFKSW